MGALYRAGPATDRLCHALGPVTILYHRRSGITHLISEPVPQILAVLDVLGTADAVAVAGTLATQFDLMMPDGAAEVVEAVVEERLAELAALGLVRREAP